MISNCHISEFCNKIFPVIGCMFKL